MGVPNVAGASGCPRLSPLLHPRATRGAKRVGGCLLRSTAQTRGQYKEFLPLMFCRRAQLIDHLRLRTTYRADATLATSAYPGFARPGPWLFLGPLLANRPKVDRPGKPLQRFLNLLRPTVSSELSRVFRTARV